ncbi:M14 family zinc carboxypeptidase [Microbacterium sp.]|uniref:M14 family zinc carboxypeptidase n=1 Tax=Microbacterium sp. TaxID=51671 RepID=UPI001ACEA43E|nr:M14 family zinc carboxypeptidase [Microbacterium sp.]MBN9184922.1 peptidase M14 [Microbacterium sp.]MBN9193703.1 peptidase M14 [Microbacterium sp.]
MIEGHVSETVCSPEDILRRAGRLAERTGFPRTDDLWAHFADLERRHPDLVSSRRIATSRLGEPIRVYTIAGGPRANIVVGGVHPNEPIGSWTAIQLADDLVADADLRTALDATWHIIPTIDPDGLRLNEGWFDQPGDRAHYARHFYRPAPDEQVEWTFPNAYKRAYFDRVLPETLGLMLLIDDVKPDLLVSLHNGEMGGVYYYLSRPGAALQDVLTRLPASLGLPLAVGEPESPYLTEYGPAIYGMGRISQAYDYLEALGVDPTTHIGGTSSAEWAGRHGTLSLVSELPYWSHPAADDTSPLDETYAELLQRTAADLAAAGAALEEILVAAEPDLTIVSPFLRASRAFVPMLGEMARTDLVRAELPESARPATVAERFDREDVVHCFKLRYGGMLLRALEAQTVAGLASADLRRRTAELASLYQDWLNTPSIADDAEVIPISRLVGVQYGAILAAAAIGADEPGAS